MKDRSYVQVTSCRGVLLRGIAQSKVIGRRRLQVDDYRVGAEIGVCGNDRAAQTAIVGCSCTGRRGGCVVGSIDVESCWERQHQVGTLTDDVRNCCMLGG